MLLRLMLCLCVMVAGPATIVSCGGDDEPERPTAVTGDDLEKAGEFWLALTPDLKDELIELAQDRLGDERGHGQEIIDALASQGLITEIEKGYANESKRDQDIYAVYVEANNSIARRQFEEVLPQIPGGGE